MQTCTVMVKALKGNIIVTKFTTRRPDIPPKLLVKRQEDITNRSRWNQLIINRGRVARSDNKNTLSIGCNGFLLIWQPFLSQEATPYPNFGKILPSHKRKQEDQNTRKSVF